MKRDSTIMLLRSFLLGLSIVFFTTCSGTGGDNSGNGGEIGGGLPVEISLNASVISSTKVYLDWSEYAWGDFHDWTSSYAIIVNDKYYDNVAVYSNPHLSITVLGLNPDTSYCFVIIATSWTIPLAKSNEVCVVTYHDNPPSVPTDVFATASSPAQIDLAWNASHDDYGVEGYRIYRDGTHIQTVESTEFSDTGLDPSKQYCYSVAAFDEAGNESTQSITACATTPEDLIPPSPPTELTAVYISSDGNADSITVSWTKSTDNGVVRGYKIYRDGTFIQDVSATSFSDTEVSSYTQYCYTVTAVDAANNESPASDAACATTSWTLTWVDDGGYSSPYFFFPSVVLDSSDRVHISYYDGKYLGPSERVGDLKYATNISGSWVKATVDADGDVGYFSSLGIDSGGHLHIAYCDFTGFTYRLKYATNISGSWIAEWVDQSLNGGYFASLEVDSVDKLHIIYYDATNLMYANNATGVWISEIVEESEGDYPSLSIDATGKAHISYYDYTNHVLKYATNVSGSWVTSIVDNTGDVGKYDSIAIDSSGKIHISYYDSGNADLKYATNTSGQWVIKIIDGADVVGQNSSLAVDALGGVHISYEDSLNNDLKYATNTTGVWSTYIIDSASLVGGQTSIALDLMGRPHIAYIASGVLRYATPQ